MFTKLKRKRSASRIRPEEGTKRQRKVIRTTIGDLIVAVMDEVTSFVRDPFGRYLVASRVLNDLLAHHQRRVPKQSRGI
jgi:hypothetical protein